MENVNLLPNMALWITRKILLFGFKIVPIWFRWQREYIKAVTSQPYVCWSIRSINMRLSRRIVVEAKHSQRHCFRHIPEFINCSIIAVPTMGRRDLQTGSTRSRSAADSSLVSLFIFMYVYNYTTIITIMLLYNVYNNVHPTLSIHNCPLIYLYTYLWEPR